MSEVTHIDDLVLVHGPSRTSYLPGQEVGMEGAAFELGGRDVTPGVTYSLEEGYTWKAADKRIEVVATYEDEDGAHEARMTLRRKSRLLPLFAAAVVAAGVVCGAALVNGTLQGGRTPIGDDTGTYIIAQGDMTREEAQAMIDDMAEKSRITVSVAPEMVLRADGSLRVNFAVPKDNNGLSERLEVIEDGKVVYSSGIVNPGYMVEWAPASGAKAGNATATVHAVDPDTRQDSGNPFSVEVKVVEE